jgi:hypothetical protein
VSNAADHDYDLGMAPIAGGDVTVGVSGWGYWNVWLTVGNYIDEDDRSDAVLQPGEAVRVATRLAVAAFRVWRLRLPDRIRGRLRGRRAVSDG